MINWDNPRKRRDRLFIIAEILDIAKDGVLKTQIMYKANLSFAQLNSYIKLLIETQLIEITNRDKKNIYKTTKKGVEYMESYKEVLETLNNHNNGNGNAPSIKGGPTIYWIKKH
ncbi:MAG: winged helix-turn-helix domain-containing protein [Candidatus Bathyarchaeia archaeon]